MSSTAAGRLAYCVGNPIEDLMPAMKTAPGAAPVRAKFPCAAAQAGVRTLFLAAACLLAGLGLGSWWRHRSAGTDSTRAGQAGTGKETRVLASGSKALLHKLEAPVEIRFYAVLEPSVVPEPLGRFIAGVDRLLAAYEREAGAKLRVTRRQARADGSAAAADGIVPFRLDSIDPCYVGLVVVQGARQESIVRLFPEWEHAVEADLSRAIERVIQPAPAPAPAPAASAPTVDPALTADVLRLVPNLASISLEEGMRVLRQSALQELKTAAEGVAGQLREAEQRLARMPEGTPEAEKQAALRDLQRLQNEQAAKLSELAARSAAQLEALRQLKGVYGDRLTR